MCVCVCVCVDIKYLQNNNHCENICNLQGIELLTFSFS